MAKPIVGTVISTKMQKTIVVRIERKFRHPMYRKVITRHKKFKAHCEDPTIQEGDTVSIKETRPISKDKHFIFVEKIGSSKVDKKEEVTTKASTTVVRKKAKAKKSK